MWGVLSIGVWLCDTCNHTYTLCLIGNSVMFAVVIPAYELVQMVMADRWDSVAKALLMGSVMTLTTVPWLGFNLYTALTHGGCPLSWWTVMITSTKILPALLIAGVKAYIGHKLLREESQTLP